MIAKKSEYCVNRFLSSLQTILLCFAFLINSHVTQHVDTTNVMVLSYLSEYQHFKYLYIYLLINLAESYDFPLSLYQKNTIAPLIAHLK